MEAGNSSILDYKIRDALTVWNNIDETDVKILEGLSLLGPRNLALLARHLDMPTTTVRYRVKQMLDDSLLFLHLNPYHTNMGLKKAVVFVEAVQGYEDVLRGCAARLSESERFLGVPMPHIWTSRWMGEHLDYTQGKRPRFRVFPPELGRLGCG